MQIYTQWLALLRCTNKNTVWLYLEELESGCWRVRLILHGISQTTINEFEQYPLTRYAALELFWETIINLIDYHNFCCYRLFKAIPK